MKILIIEDSPEISETLALCFECNWPNADVITAVEGRKGIKLLKDFNFDFVILDINLPDMDGFSVLHEVRGFSDVPIIILTVRGNDADKKRGLETGANDYISKPFKAKELVERISTALGKNGIIKPNDVFSEKIVRCS